MGKKEEEEQERRKEYLPVQSAQEMSASLPVPNEKMENTGEQALLFISTPCYVWYTFFLYILGYPLYGLSNRTPSKRYFCPPSTAANEIVESRDLHFVDVTVA